MTLLTLSGLPVTAGAQYPVDAGVSAGSPLRVGVDTVRRRRRNARAFWIQRRRPDFRILLFDLRRLDQRRRLCSRDLDRQHWVAGLVAGYWYWYW